MITDKNFTKIKTFISDQVDLVKNSIVITKTSKGFKVNDLRVLSKNDLWVILDHTNTELATLKNRRLALLAAAVIIKKQWKNADLISNYDSKLFTLKHDKVLFEDRIQRKFNTALFEDRYSRTISELDLLYSQISNLEKSVGLQ